MIVLLNEKINAEKLETAIRWNDNRFCVIPIHADGSKKPSGNWKIYQSRRSSIHELRDWYGEDLADSHDIGIVCGTVSDNLTILDFDEKNEVGNFKKWVDACSV